MGRRGGEDTGPEGQVPRAAEDRGESVGDPDVLLDVPVLKVEELELEVEDLRARVSFQAELADMVKINVGVDAEVGKAKIELQGVEAQARVKARLDNVRAIFSEVLAALQRDPELARNMLRSAGAADEPSGETRSSAGRPRPGGRSPAEEPDTAQPGSDGAGGLAGLRIEEEYVDEQGNLIGRARDESGRLVEEVLDEDGSVLGSKTSPEAGPGEDEEAVEATEAARRRAGELGLKLSDVEGTGSGGRILVRDVENAYDGDGG